MRLWPWQWPHRRPYGLIGRRLDAIEAAAARQRLLDHARQLGGGR